jgi:hypothetical protein
MTEQECQEQDAKHLVTLDKRDLFDALRAAWNEGNSCEQMSRLEMFIESYACAKKQMKLLLEPHDAR